MVRIVGRFGLLWWAMLALLLLACNGGGNGAPRQTHIAFFLADATSVARGTAVTLSWEAHNPGAFPGTASCSISRRYQDGEAQAPDPVDCKGSLTEAPAAPATAQYVTYQLNVLRHPYDENASNPYLIQVLRIELRDADDDTPETAIVRFEVEPARVQRDEQIRLDWRVRNPGTHADTPPCSLTRRFNGQPAEEPFPIACEGSLQEVPPGPPDAAYVRYQLNALKRPYDPADPYITAVVTITLDDPDPDPEPDPEPDPDPDPDPDPAAPTVTATVPADGATDVAVDTSISVTFSLPMNPTATESALTSEPAIDCAFTWSDTDTTLTCTPTTTLPPDTLHSITITTQATDSDGAPMTEDHTITFTTGPDPDPNVQVSITPTTAELTTGASRSFTATVTGTNDTSVTWNATCGTITGDGNTITYTAPESEGECEVVATSVVDPDASATAIVTATFVGRHTLSVTKSGSGNGTVTSNPSGIDCGSICSAQFDHDQSVTLTPNAAGNSEFDSWLGCQSTSDIQCTVLMTQNRSVSATFTQPPVILVTPSSRNVGDHELGSSATTTFTVRNDGGGTLVGSASVTSPYSIVSGGSYNLSADQSQTVTVRFTPTALGSATRTVSYSGGGSASTTVTGEGVDLTPPTISITNPSSGTIVNSGVSSVTVAGAASDSGSGVSTVRYSLNGGTFHSCSYDSSNSGAFSCNVTNLTNGNNAISVRATDNAGNHASANVTVGRRPAAPTSVTNYSVTSPYEWRSDPNIACLAVQFGHVLGTGAPTVGTPGPSAPHRWGCISWEAPPGQIDSVRVLRSAGPSSPTTIVHNSLSPTTTLASDAGAQSTTPYVYGVLTIKDGITSDTTWATYYTRPATNFHQLSLFVPGIGGYQITDRTNTTTPVTGNTRSVRFEWTNPWGSTGDRVNTHVKWYEAENLTSGGGEITGQSQLMSTLTTSPLTHNFSQSTTTAFDMYTYHWRGFGVATRYNGPSVLDPISGVVISTVTRFTVDKTLTSDQFGPDTTPPSLFGW